MDFKEKKQTKERGCSVNELIDELVEVKESVEELMIVTIDADGGINLSYSLEDDAKAIGMLEVIKQSVIDGIMDY